MMGDTKKLPEKPPGEKQPGKAYPVDINNDPRLEQEVDAQGAREISRPEHMKERN